MDKEDGAIRRDPAVNSVILLGFQVNDVIEIAKMLKQEEFLSAKSLIDKLETEGKQKEKSVMIPDSSDNTQTDIDQMRTLQEENLQIREQMICKICLDKDVSVVFLPCGHLVSCVDCSCALVDCPVCRSHVMGIARAILS
ncbi:E3 ubiquitin-protein ligase XIAP-like isoform X1 [Biomphalaria pfeifferi]|uniref:E3 ubiquitin-protein ligase XIAP-like isoform X1 n=1 Tax=Biomphalaria pfeifferi TaxID=112525 RepID=A0AAD8FGA1_BIOPF|nr:E3 ubiquitin-protein ligase XIAP-like isoform X1 [Biomphalaria pfeifferi]